MTKLNTLMRIAAAAAIGSALGLPAAAQMGPRVVGTGDNASVEYDAPNVNIVGGALQRFTGSGESAEMEAISVQHARRARPSIVIGSGESSQTVYLDEVPDAVFTGAAQPR